MEESLRSFGLSHSTKCQQGSEGTEAFWISFRGSFASLTETWRRTMDFSTNRPTDGLLFFQTPSSGCHRRAQGFILFHSKWDCWADRPTDGLKASCSVAVKKQNERESKVVECLFRPEQQSFSIFFLPHFTFFPRRVSNLADKYWSRLDLEWTFSLFIQPPAFSTLYLTRCRVTKKERKKVILARVFTPELSIQKNFIRGIILRYVTCSTFATWSNEEEKGVTTLFIGHRYAYREDGDESSTIHLCMYLCSKVHVYFRVGLIVTRR